MSSLTTLSREQLLPALAATVTGKRWHQRLLDLLDADADAALHVAIMHEPYLEHVLTGRKTIESRFSVNRICPFEAVEPGDVLAFKAQSGPIVGLALVEHTAFYELDSATWRSLRRDFAGPLCAADDEFWDRRAHARYASLLRICEPARMPPVPVIKNDRRGWVRLPGSCVQQTFAL